MKIESIELEFPEGCNIILGQSHFIKTVEDLYECIVTNVPSVKFGLAFSEASGPCLIRYDGNDKEAIDYCCKNLEMLKSGHCFMIILRDTFPINFLNSIKNIAEVCSIYCATANPVSVIVARLDNQSAILGVADGFHPKGIEGEQDKQIRHKFLRDIGYKR